MTFSPIPQNITQDGKKLSVLTMHPTWMEHGVTIALVDKLKKRRDQVILNLETLSNNATVSDTAIRIEGIKLAQLNEVIQTIYDIQKLLSEH